MIKGLDTSRGSFVFSKNPAHKVDGGRRSRSRQYVETKLRNTPTPNRRGGDMP